MKKLGLMVLVFFAGFAAFAQQQDNALPKLAVVTFSTNTTSDKNKADAITVRNLVFCKP
ncbi:hypothetical protein FACS1894200_10050 [Spirochaetia bacterium]|nr:hypothetical protein FACS1894200_10050 [Spirochaetia bacterium]